MIAQVRPLRREYTAASLRHLWGVVLPATPVERGPSAPRSESARGVPAARGMSTARRHYTGGANHGRLQRPLEHATRLIPTARLVTVLTREASLASRDDLAGLPGVIRCVQPSSRGTAPEVFLAALAVLQHDPHAIVATLPANHLMEQGPRFMQYVARAAGAVAIRPELPVVVAAYPGSDDPEYAWVEAGEPIDGLEAFTVHAVRRFIRWPSPAERSGGLLGTLALVMSAQTLVALGRRYLPDVLECLEPLEGIAGCPEETLLCDAVWESMPRASVCADLLVHVKDLGVVSMPDAMTGEWARPMAHALAS